MDSSSNQGNTPEEERGEWNRVYQATLDLYGQLGQRLMELRPGNETRLNYCGTSENFSSAPAVPNQVKTVLDKIETNDEEEFREEANVGNGMTEEDNVGVEMPKMREMPTPVPVVVHQFSNVDGPSRGTDIAGEAEVEHNSARSNPGTLQNLNSEPDLKGVTRDTLATVTKSKRSGQEAVCRSVPTKLPRTIVGGEQPVPERKSSRRSRISRRGNSAVVHIYVCPKCKQEFTDQSARIQHFKTEHHENYNLNHAQTHRFGCHRCGATFHFLADLGVHIRNNHGQGRVRMEKRDHSDRDERLADFEKEAESEGERTNVDEEDKRRKKSTTSGPSAEKAESEGERTNVDEEDKRRKKSTTSGPSAEEAESEGERTNVDEEGKRRKKSTTSGPSAEEAESEGERTNVDEEDKRRKKSTTSGPSAEEAESEGERTNVDEEDKRRKKSTTSGPSAEEADQEKPLDLSLAKRLE